MLKNGAFDVPPSFAKRLDRLREQVRAGDPRSAEGSQPMRWELRELEVWAEEAGRRSLADSFRRLGLLTEVWECVSSESPEGSRRVAEFCDEALGRLGGPSAFETAEEVWAWLDRESLERWGNYIGLLAPEGLGTGRPREVFSEDSDDDTAPASSTNIVKMIVQLAGLRPSTSAPSESTPSPRPGELGPVPRAGRPDARRSSPPPLPEATDAYPSPLDDLETREAFRADAEDLLERIEASTRLLSERGRDEEALRDLGRALHTLKGAAGAVGLSDIVETVHDLEGRNEEAEASPGALPEGFIDRLLELLGEIEYVLAPIRLGAGDAEPVEDVAAPSEQGVQLLARPPGSSGSPRVYSSEDQGEGDGMVRVPRARIDDLLDLVSELLILNGSWSSWSGKVKDYASAARSCRNRLTSSIDRLCDLDRGLIGPEEEEADPDAPEPGALRKVTTLVNHLAEQAEDLALLAHSIRASSDRLADDADASARLTHQFWDLLNEIRIVSVRSLFHRLARVARAAAVVEGRKVDVVLVGEEVGLDRSIQERAFEPLLHIVRNAVGHGIEPEADRLSAGKTAVGQLTLEAVRDRNTVIVSVRDDGRGMDYPAIEAKARDLGWIEPDELPSLERLNAMVFRPGFSTTKVAGAISGRGIGMDVVAQEVARLHGTVSLESSRGRGTTITLRVPARLSLELAMVVRIDGQAFALPLEAIDMDEADAGGTEGEFPSPVDCREVLKLPRPTSSSPPQRLLVKIGGERRAILIDSIDGPRELVIKPLNPLLVEHPAISGTSLSVDGELVLVLELAGLLEPHLVDFDRDRAAEALASRPDPVLIVDDSVSVRRSAARHLNTLGLEVEEAFDGVEALRKLRDRSYRLILTDLHMPRMDGFELIEVLNRSGASTPIVVTSSQSDADTRRRVLGLGARAFVGKPAGIEDLAEAIGPILSGAPDSTSSLPPRG